MLLLTFRSAGSLYAVDARQVVEVVPRVALRSIPHAPPYLSGLLSYRNGVVPVVDFNVLIGGSAGQNVLSTRMILAEFATSSGEVRQVGLIAEHVSDIVRGEPSQRVLGDIGLATAPYLGEVYQLESELVQLVIPARLLPNQINEALLLENVGSEP